MKKKNLLVAALAVCISAGAFAQEDITPSRYVFTNLPTGQFSIDAVNPGANPPAGWAAVTDGYNNGFVALCGGPALYTSLDADQPKGFRQGTNIVDLGGEIGKVLAIRGTNSKYNAGTAMGSGYTGTWCNLNLYLDKDKTPINEKVRVRMVFSVYENTISNTGSFLGKFYTSNFQNNASPNPNDDQVQIFPSDYFMALDEEGDPLEDKDGFPVYDPTKWMIHEMDITIPEAAGNPTRLKIEFTAGLLNGTIFIKEVQFIKNPTGEPVQRKIVKYTGGTSSVNTVNGKTLDLSVKGNTVTLSGLKGANPVNIYNMTGQKVNSFIATGDNAAFELSAGLYMINVSGKTAKVLVK